jgi:hypothetical protein
MGVADAFALVPAAHERMLARLQPAEKPNRHPEALWTAAIIHRHHSSDPRLIPMP